MKTLVLWGEPHSGKSGLLGALRSEAARTAGERWALDLADAGPEAIEFVDSASLALRLRDVKETVVRRPEGAVTLAVKRLHGTREQDAVQLLVLDPPGLLMPRIFGGDAREVMHALATADGVVWLIEATERSGNVVAREGLLHQLVAALAAAKAPQLAAPVAVVLTKLDRLPADEMRKALDQPERALREQLGDAAFGWLLAACPRLHCFGLTAAGTVRNAARPVGLGAIFDWFTTEWRRSERQSEQMETRQRRSARVAHVRRKAPIAALAIAAAAVVVFAGGAAARKLMQRTTWSTASGGIAVTTSDSQRAMSPPKRALESPVTAVAGGAVTATTPGVSLDSVIVSYQRGDARAMLRNVIALGLPASDTGWFAADSLVALVAVRGIEEALRAAPADSSLLQLVVSATSAAIGRAHPGTYVLAPLSVARAEACIAARLDCPADRVREDLAWALLLGTPEEQDMARRLRAAWLADTISPGS